MNEVTTSEGLARTLKRPGCRPSPAPTPALRSRSVSTLCTWHLSLLGRGGYQGKLSYWECVLSFRKRQMGGWPSQNLATCSFRGKLRQGWNPSLSFRGGVSRKLSLELEHSVFAFSRVQEEERRNEASPFTDGKTKETWHPHPSSLGETKYSALSTLGNHAGRLLCACGVSP